MLGRFYENEVCSAARALEFVGERWSLLIIRDALYWHVTRFSEFQRRLDIAPNILAKRLAEFVDGGIMEVRDAGDGGRGEYVLTDKGRDLQPVVLALTAWGDRWAVGPNGPPGRYLHADCGGEVEVHTVCDRCGAEPDATAVEVSAAEWAIEFRKARSR